MTFVMLARSTVRSDPSWGRFVAENTESVARRMNECLNAHDLDAYASLFSDDYELTDTSTGEVFRGPEGALRNIEPWLMSFPDARNAGGSLGTNVILMPATTRTPSRSPPGPAARTAALAQRDPCEGGGRAASRP
jgi:hypothetical protein